MYTPCSIFHFEGRWRTCVKPWYFDVFCKLLQTIGVLCESFSTFGWSALSTLPLNEHGCGLEGGNSPARDLSLSQFAVCCVKVRGTLPVRSLICREDSKGVCWNNCTEGLDSLGRYYVGNEIMITDNRFCLCRWLCLHFFPFKIKYANFLSIFFLML